MAIIQVLLAAILHSLGRIANTALGWATVMLFGRVPQDRQIYLSGIALGAVVWMVVVLGIAFPSLATFLLTFITLPPWIPSYVVRLAMLAAAVLLPPLVGAASLLLMPPEARPRGRERVVAVLRGYRSTIGYAVALLMLIFVAPTVQIRNIFRRWTTRHIPVIVHSEDYAEVVDDTRRALAAGGMPMRQEEAGWVVQLPARLLAILAGGTPYFARTSLVRLFAARLEILLYPFDLMISGPEREVAHAQAIIAAHLTFTKAYMTWSREANQVEDQLRALWAEIAECRDPQRKKQCREELRALGRRLSTLKLPYEEWEVLFRGKLLVERQLFCEREAEDVAMGRVSGGSTDGEDRDASSAPSGYRSRTDEWSGDHRARTEDAIARLRQLLADFLAVLQDYVGRRSQDALTAVKMTVRDEVIGLVFISAAATLGFLALCLMVVSAVLALSVSMAPWGAALIVSGVLSGFTVFLLVVGMRRMRFWRLRALVRMLRQDAERIRAALFASQRTKDASYRSSSVPSGNGPARRAPLRGTRPGGR